MKIRPNFIVSIRCMTYNHAPYIEDAMNGFCMQRTTFPYVAIIIDDASTDGEPEVIQKYLDEHFILNEEGVARQWETSEARFIYARHKENPNCFFAVVLLKYNYYSIKKSKVPLLEEWSDTEYIAICEGDDYWIDLYKLQKQVDFLDLHPDFIICSCRYNLYYQNTGILQLCNDFMDLCWEKEERVEYFEYTKDIYNRGWYTQPLTALYRNGRYLYEIPAEKYSYYRDTVFYYYVLKQGKGALMKDIMGVYRKHNGGLYTGQSFLYNRKVSLITYIELYNNSCDTNFYCAINRIMNSLVESLREHPSYTMGVLKIFVYYMKNAPKDAKLILLKQYCWKWLHLSQISRGMKKVFCMNQ